MDRKPPSNVRKILRKEVNFGCPVPGCGSPFLTWHHFDPPWSTLNHHNPDGMIALCTKCHPMADAGTFSIDKLRLFKSKPNTKEFITAKFEWMPENCIIRLGGCYAPDWCRINILDITVLEIKKDEDGITSINFVLKNNNDQLMASMSDNIIEIIPDAVHDLIITASANFIKIWSDKRQIGLECHYSRKTPSEIEIILNKDTPIIPDFVGQPVPIDNLEEFYEELSRIPESDQERIAAIAFRRRDPVGTFIRWHISRHIGTDNKIPFLDFCSCRFYHLGKCVELKNGFLGGLEFCGGNTFAF